MKKVIMLLCTGLPLLLCTTLTFALNCGNSPGSVTVNATLATALPISPYGAKFNSARLFIKGVNTRRNPSHASEYLTLQQHNKSMQVKLPNGCGPYTFGLNFGHYGQSAGICTNKAIALKPGDNVSITFQKIGKIGLWAKMTCGISK